MKPHQLVGMPYRLGADPEKHGSADCLSLARCVLRYYGVKSPAPTREWYRRLKSKDYAIFKEQLELWGVRVKHPKIRTVGLCRSDDGFGLSIFWEGGWLNFQKIFGESEVVWSPAEVLELEGLYYPKKQNYVISSV